MRLKKWMLIFLLGIQAKQAYGSEPDKLKTRDEIFYTKEQLLALGYKLSDDHSRTINRSGYLVGSAVSLICPNLIYAGICGLVAGIAGNYFESTEPFCRRFLFTLAANEATKVLPFNKDAKEDLKLIILGLSTAVTAYDLGKDRLFPKIKAKKETSKTRSSDAYAYDEMMLQKMFWSDKFQALDAKISLKNNGFILDGGCQIRAPSIFILFPL